MTEATTSIERRQAGAAYAAGVSALLTPAANPRGAAGDLGRRCIG